MTMAPVHGPESGDTAAVLQAALSLACCQGTGPAPAVTSATERTLTRRGVIWLGQTCNLKCRFCYFIERVAQQTHPEHPFMELAKAKAICQALVGHYGNDAVDLQGGEPTLFPGIYELVSHCRAIGLRPTLITNGLLLDDPERCQKFKDSGISDFLLSVQGLGTVHDDLVCCPGAHRRQMLAIRNLQQAGIPFRFNVVMSKPALPQLPTIAELALRTGALVVNFITFNPFADQSTQGKRCSDNVPRYSEAAPWLAAALDLLEAGGIEANVRYFPFCMVEERHRKNVYNFQQLSYDPHEWDLASWGWTGMQPQRMRDGELTPPPGLAVPRSFARLRVPMKRLAENRMLRPFLYGLHALLTRAGEAGANRDELYRRVARMHAEQYCGYAHGPGCSGCGLKSICDGLHGDYAGLFGTEEVRAIIDSVTDHPLYYAGNQDKVAFLYERES